MHAKKRTGRPPLPEKDRKSAVLRHRVRGDIYERIATAAAASGRPMSDEVEARLRASFDNDDLRKIIREELRAELRSGATAALAETAEERTKGYLRAAIDRDPNVKAALHRQGYCGAVVGQTASQAYGLQDATQGLGLLQATCDRVNGKRAS